MARPELERHCWLELWLQAAVARRKRLVRLMNVCVVLDNQANRM